MCPLRRRRSDVILFVERGREGEVVEPTPGAPNQERAMAHPPHACAATKRERGRSAAVADFPPKM